MSDSLVQTVRTDTFEMDYAKIGSGDKPLIVIPGISIKNPLNFANSFSVPYKIFLNNYTLYFFDRKKEAKPGYTLEQMADDQVEALKAIGIEKADIFGVSQGGMIAQYIAIRHPQIVNKLVLGSSTSRPEPLQLETIGKWARLADSRKAQELVDSFLDKCFSEKFLARYRRALKAMYETVTDAEMERFSVFAHACDFVNTYDDLGKIKSPTLVLGAGTFRVDASAALEPEPDRHRPSVGLFYLAADRQIVVVVGDVADVACVAYLRCLVKDFLPAPGYQFVLRNSACWSLVLHHGNSPTSRMQPHEYSTHQHCNTLSLELY